MSGNEVTLVGTVTRDPELRFTASGRAVASFGLAHNKRWQNRQTKEWEESVSFFEITCWQELAENVCESLAKGSRAFVTGRLEQQTWGEEGARRSKVQVVADDCGPSLRFATAQVAKNPRRDGGENARPVANEPPGGYSDEEEPF